MGYSKGAHMVRERGGSLHTLARIGILILALITLGNCPLLGQGSTATISGVVKDTTGALVPGVTINIKHVESGLIRTAVTSENGGYSVQFLPVGPYELTTEMPGFKQQVRSGINLAVAQEAVVNLTLEVGNVAEKITVIEEAPLVNTTLSPTSGLI